MKQLKKVLIIASLSLVATFGIAQEKNWKDGNPFQETVNVINVKIDSVISLIPTPGYREEPDSFQYILDVFDSTWVWPAEVPITSAADIEYYADDNGDHYVVTDVDGRKIIDVVLPGTDPAWIFEGDIGSPRYLKEPVDTYVYKVGNEPFFLITDPGGQRVIKVDRYRNSILWQYGDGTEGDGFNQLYNPTDAIALPHSGQVLICDKSNKRIILVNEADTTIAWQWGADTLKRPVDIDYDFNTGEILITDQGNNQIIKIVAGTDSIIWAYDDSLDSPSDADLLSNGNVLICDKNNNRLIEVDMNKQIVWQLASALENLEDADRLMNNMHLVVSNGQPSRAGYLSKDFVSGSRYLGREVGFDSLIWSANTIPGLTSVRIQLRSANTRGDLDTAPWLGPAEDVPYYIIQNSKINPAHNGHKYYEFKATLQTSDPLYTPTLNNLKVTYNFYDTETTGQVFSGLISDPDEDIITRWKSLKFTSILPPNPANRDKVEIKITILDTNNVALRNFVASKVDTSNEVSLDDIEGLERIQSIRLQANLSTNSTAATPVLKNWEVIWDATPLTGARIYFADENLDSADYYQVPALGETSIDYAIVKLIDPNLIPLQDIVDVDASITSQTTQDSEQVTLTLQREGWFLTKPGLPIFIADSISQVMTNDGELQVFDRDSLIVFYQDPITASDQASDTVLIVQNTEGIIQFVNTAYSPIDTAAIGDTIFVQILGEKDQDLSLQTDTISVVVFEYETSDKETLAVIELANPGDFRSTGLRLLPSKTPIPGDSLMQTFAGSRIGVEYDDTIVQLPILHVVPGDNIVPVEAYLGARSLDFDMAPNPYYGNRHNELRIRVASSIGNITVEKIEIFNFAGQKITEIDGTRLNFYYLYPIPAQQFSYADGWWNLTDQNSVPVSSGTYWIKVVGKAVNTNKHLSHIKKLVVIR